MTNNKLAEILDWAMMAKVDLDSSEIVLKHSRWDSKLKKDVDYPRVTFFHDREMADNIRQLKRAVELKPKGQPPYMTLQATIVLGCGEVELVYEGAYECKVSHQCKPKGWAKHQISDPIDAMGDEPVDADVMMED